MKALSCESYSYAQRDNVERKSGFARRPPPFDCKFTPRYPDVLEILEDTLESYEFKK